MKIQDLELKVCDLESKLRQLNQHPDLAGQTQQVLNSLPAMPNIELLNEDSNELTNELKHLIELHIRVRWVLSRTLHISGLVVKALQPAQEALQLITFLGEREKIFLHLDNLAQIHYKLLNYQESLECVNRAIEIAEAVEKKTMKAQALSTKAVLYRLITDYATALDYSQTSLKLYEECNDKYNIGRVNANMGNLYFNIADYDKALQLYKKALDIYSEIGDNGTYGINIAIGNIGLVYLKQEDYDNASEYLKKALMLCQNTNDQEGVAIYTELVGACYIGLGRYTQAHALLQSAAQTFDLIGQEHRTAAVLQHMGGLYSTADYDGYDLTKAENSLMQAVEIFSRSSEKYGLYETYETLSTLCEKQGKLGEALEHFKKYHKLQNEIKSEEAANQAQMLEHRRKLEDAERDRQVKLARFQEQEKILHNILPVQIAERIMKGDKQIADSCDHVSVFFCDIVGFTQLSQHISARELVAMLSNIFTEFDRIAQKHGLEKIKTIGDAYMAVAGIPLQQNDHATRAADFAIEVMCYMQRYQHKTGENLKIRAGLHCGHAVAGVIGETKFAYDLWGDAVNTASRMESHGEPDKIHISEDFKNSLPPNLYQIVERGAINVKGKGEMKTYFIHGRNTLV
jgi:class 3 adenylate cyclase